MKRHFCDYCGAEIRYTKENDTDTFISAFDGFFSIPTTRSVRVKTIIGNVIIQRPVDQDIDVKEDCCIACFAKAFHQLVVPVPEDIERVRVPASFSNPTTKGGKDHATTNTTDVTTQSSDPVAV